MDYDHGWRAVFAPGRATRFFDLARPPRFDAVTRGYSPANAWWLAELSRWIYRPAAGGRRRRRSGPSRDALLAQVGLREARSFDRRGTQCAVVEPRAPAAAGYTLVVFRGTESLRDWLANLQAVPTRWPAGGRVHRGFRRALDAVWGELDGWLGARGAPAFFTGHSLGAALATLAASRRPPRALYTFGSPRVGDGGFAAALAAVPCFRVVNGRDLVTRFPPAAAVGFRHAGELHRLAPGGARDGLAAGCPLAARAPEGRPAAHARRWHDPPTALADHAPVNYVASLERAL